MPKAENDPGFVKLPAGLHSIEDALCGDFCVTTKRLCRALMCSRQFVADHCKAIPHIYVPKRWALQIDPDFHGGVYWSLKALNELADKAVIERRTHVVGATEVLDGSELEWYRETMHKVSQIENRFTRHEVFDDARGKFFEHSPGEWQLAFEARAEARPGRGNTGWGDYGERGARFEQLGTVFRTIADMRGYGDCDEEWHRYIWSTGAVRLVFVLPDGTERKMYACDPTADKASGGINVLMPVELLPKVYLREMLSREHQWKALPSLGVF